MRSHYSLLCVTPSFPGMPGDREGNYVYDSLAALARQGVEVSVIVTRPYVPAPLQGWLGKAAEPLRAADFPSFASVETVFHLSLPRNYWRPFSNGVYDNQVGAAIRRRVAQQTIVLIHAHGEGAAPIVVHEARRAGIPAVVTLHGIDMCPRYMAPAQRVRFRQALNAMDQVILVGEPLREHFRAITGRDEHFRVVHNGFVPPPAELCAASKARGWAKDGFVEFISVSNLHEGKGIDLNLQALAQLVSQGHTRWRYRVVGDGDQRGALAAETLRLGLERYVEFLGAKGHGDVYELLVTAHVFILPSYREAFGIAYLEAMALGLLTVGVQGQGPAAFLRDGENGILVHPRDARALAGRLVACFIDPTTCHAIAQRGRVEALSHWTWESHACQLLSVYDEVLQG